MPMDTTSTEIENVCLLYFPSRLIFITNIAIIGTNDPLI